LHRWLNDPAALRQAQAELQTLRDRLFSVGTARCVAQILLDRLTAAAPTTARAA
jgi:hypothetical protein